MSNCNERKIEEIKIENRHFSMSYPPHFLEVMEGKVETVGQCGKLDKEISKIGFREAVLEVNSNSKNGSPSSNSVDSVQGKRSRGGPGV